MRDLLRACAVVALAGSVSQQLSAQAAQPDWPALGKYQKANAELGVPKQGEQRVVFMGNSITEGWAPRFDSLFPGKPYVGRGISGQTTPQMLLRFRQDVIALRPNAVVILGGTNDIAGNTGPSTLEMIEDNLVSMTELAKANDIRVVLVSVLPAADFPWAKGRDPAPKIIALNRWIKDYAARAGVVYLDLHSAMSDANGGMRPELSKDGVHPNDAGYALMAKLTGPAIDRALTR